MYLKASPAGSFNFGQKTITLFWVTYLYDFPNAHGYATVCSINKVITVQCIKAFLQYTTWDNLWLYNSYIKTGQKQPQKFTFSWGMPSDSPNTNLLWQPLANMMILLLRISKQTSSIEVLRTTAKVLPHHF